MAVKKTQDVEEKIEKEVKLPTKKVKKLSDDTMITVIGNFPGDLFYRSPRTQDEWRWEFGDEDEMSIRELKTMKSTHRRFFEDKWIIFAEHQADDVIKHLKLEKYYSDGISNQDDWDSIFELSVDELADIIDTATHNEKSLIINLAREQYESGKLTNLHVIRLIEEKLQVSVDVNNPNI
jgi:hypothetical protein